LIPLCERTVIAGKYRLERELANGGMGAVWVARHLGLDELVAVKFMSGHLPELCDARARFAREARAAALARGPHVVEVLDHGADGDLPYIVMELLQGETLGERLKRERRLPLDAVARIATQIARALARAHRAGIVHRDLKPANVFLARVDDEEMVKILDFGIAKRLTGDDQTDTHHDVLMGSPQYMSPEQARGSRNVDHRADLWSLAAILYRAVTGMPAFDGVSTVDVIIRICTGPAPSPRLVAPDLPEELDVFFAKALARDPVRRFGSARELAEAFATIARRAEERGRSEPPRAPLSTYVKERSDGDEDEEPLTDASPKEIDSFVEHAFEVLLDSEQRTAAAIEAPPTVRAATMRPAPPVETVYDAPAPPTVPTVRAAPASLVLPALHDLHSPGAESASYPRGTHHDDRLSTVAALLDRGFSALRGGDPESARRAWREALSLDPANRMVELNLRRLEAIGREPTAGGVRTK
jgi:serine/threonine-protein kinase